MKTTELRELSDSELVERLEELKEELFNLRFQNVTGQLDNPSRLKEVRRDIARVLTVQRERELELEAQGADSGASAGAERSESR